MSANEPFYENCCKALLLVGAVIQWATAWLMVENMKAPELASHFASLIGGIRFGPGL